jgi:Tfp pilus assembly protein PilX
VIARLRARLLESGGFAMITVMGVMLVGGLLVMGALASSDADISLARVDQDRRAAYAAAEAGVNVYTYHLNQDNGYWARCTNVPPPNSTESAAINQAWNGTGTDPRSWRNLPGSSAKWSVELLPANGFSQCTESQAQASMVDQSTGAFRIRSTGKVGKSKRSIVATYRRRSFIDYIYFTDFETSDPVTYSNPSDVAWASVNCARWNRQGRSSACTRIQFVGQDVVAGPFHTNDDILTCGAPTFGRSAADSIEVSGPNPGYATNCGNIRPNFLGTWTTSSPVLTLPPSNSTLNSLAGVRFTGTTRIVLNGATMTVTDQTGAVSTVPIPANGVVYVQSGSCGSSGYTIVQNYTTPTGCGDVYVRGTTSRSITIAADNDVIVNGDIRRSGDVLVGLIANNFVRIYHPVTRTSGGDEGDGGGGTCNNAPGYMQDVTIEAAILALQHSFIVDNYYCGARLGTLTVNGAIAQKFRGPVGVTGSSNSGYTKSYNYDDRLRYREPPSFLDPVQVSWRVVRQTEQVPPR